MIIRCNRDGTEHYHDSLDQLARCAAGRDLIVTIGPPAVDTKGTDPMGTAPVSDGYAGRHPDARPTPKQLRYIIRLNGSWRDAYSGTRKMASELIAALQNADTKEFFSLPETSSLDDPAWEAFPRELAWRRGELGPIWDDFSDETGELCGAPAAKTMPMPAPVPGGPDYVLDEDDIPRTEPKNSDKLKIMIPLLEKVPDGYYALDLGTGKYNDMRFFRLTRPKTGKYRDTIKVQTIHGDRLEIGWVRWPSERISVYNTSIDIEGYLLALMSDHRTAALTFAREKGRCCCCGKGLTDERSRHYGIGPECEKFRPDIIARIDHEEAEKAGR